MRVSAYTPDRAAPYWALRPSPKRPDLAGEDPDLESYLRESSGRRLLCRACHEVITSEAHRIEIGGRHVHRRINPAGIEFEFGCFDAAGGAATLGELTVEHCWFPGYAWLYSICGRCAAHLGWFFEGTEPSFHGLILRELELEDEKDEED